MHYFRIVQSDWLHGKNVSWFSISKAVSNALKTLQKYAFFTVIN